MMSVCRANPFTGLAQGETASDVSPPLGSPLPVQALTPRRWLWAANPRYLLIHSRQARTQPAQSWCNPGAFSWMPGTLAPFPKRRLHRLSTLFCR